MIVSFSQTLCVFILGLLLQTYTGWPIQFLAGPCIMFMYTTSRSFCLWAAFLSGLFLDCLMLSPRLGLMATSWVVALATLYPWRLYFFKDSRSTLIIMTYLFVFLTSLLEALFALLLDLPTPLFSLRWCVSDLVLMPLLDAMWAFGASYCCRPYWLKSLLQNSWRAKNRPFGPS